MPSRERVAAYAAGIAVGGLGIAGLSVLLGTEPGPMMRGALAGALGGAAFIWFLGPLSPTAAPQEQDAIGQQVLAEALKRAKAEVVVSLEFESKVTASFWRRLHRKP